MARQHARRRRREQAAGVAVFCLGVLVLVVAVIALQEPRGHVTAAASSHSASSVAKESRTSSPSSHPRPGRGTSPTSRSASVGAVKDVPLVVLNNTTIKGLASQAAQRFEAGGWKVTESGNLTNEIISTCAYYDPAQPGAKAAAEALRAQYPTIKRLAPKFPELPAGPVVVVLTPDYTAA